MTNKIRNSILVLVIVIVVGSIWYLESKKSTVNPTTAADVQTPAANAQNRQEILAEKAEKYPKAKEFVDPTGFINAQPFTLSSLIGKKVILLDFWTYSCINCQRTIPYLEAWYQKYQNDGLVVIGVHTPEFDFEKNYDNVAAAVKAAGITYPIVMDSDMETWNAYGNEYWPEEYLIDIDGYVVHNNIGEGNYAETEQAIQKALTERSSVLGLNLTIPTGTTNPADAVAVDPSKIQSQETYFGSNRNDYLVNGNQAVTGPQTMTLPATLSPDALYLGGTWDFTPEYAESVANSTVEYNFTAKNVYFVASSTNGATLKLLVDGKPLGSAAGSDVSADSTISIKANKLYNLISGQNYETHTLQIQVESGVLDAYTFTFG